MNADDMSLFQMAERVAGWVTHEAITNRFRARDRAFYEHYKVWRKRNEAYEQGIQVRTGETKAEDDKRREQLEKPGPNPLDWLELPRSGPFKDLITSLGDDKLPVTPDRDCALQAQYVLITIVHDNVPAGPRTRPISEGIWPADECWVVDKWQEIEDNYTDPKIASAIRCAYRHVQGDLLKGGLIDNNGSPVKQLRETEQTATVGKRQRLWTCVKKIPRWVCGLIVALLVAIIAAIVVEIFSDFGWLERIKKFIYRMLGH
jgi:hypothetical protein